MQDTCNKDVEDMGRRLSIVELPLDSGECQQTAPGLTFPDLLIALVTTARNKHFVPGLVTIHPDFEL